MISQLGLAIAGSVIFSALLAGCSSTGSSNIQSAGLYAVSSVKSQDGQATCSTTLTVGGSNGTYVDVSGTDHLYCNGVQMTKVTNPLNQISYQANVPSIELSHYEIKFVRTGETLMADVDLPALIRNPQIVGGGTHGIGQAFAVSWDKDTQTPSVMSGSLILNNQKRDQSKVAASSISGTDQGALIFAPSDTTITASDAKTQVQSVVPGPYSGQVILTRAAAGLVTGSWQGTVTSAQTVSLDVTLQ